MAGTTPDLVVRVAANISALQADMKQAAGSIKTIEDAATSARAAGAEFVSTLKEIAGAAGIGFSIESAVAFLHTIAEEAHQLNILSLQTRINVEDLQVLTAATKEFGVEGDQLGRALFNLQQRIAGNDPSVATAYHLMGLSLDEVRGKNAMDLFLTTERALGTLGGAIQDTAAKDLYGARLGASLIAFSSGVDEAMEKARRFNTIASTESVKAAAEAADAIDRVTRSVHAMVIEMEGNAARAVIALHQNAQTSTGSWGKFGAMLEYARGAFDGTGMSGSSLALILDGLNTRTADGTSATTQNAGAHREAAVALDAHGQAAKFMALLELDAAKPLLEWQVAYLTHLKDIGQLTAQNAIGIGVNVLQFEKYKAGLEAAKKAAEDLTKAEAEHDAIAMTAYEKRIRALQALESASQHAYSFEGQVAQLRALDAAEQALTRTVYASITSEKDRAKLIEESSLRHLELMNQINALEQKHVGVVNDAIVAELEARAKLEAAMGRNVDGTVGELSAYDKLQIALDKLHAKKVEGVSQYEQEQVLMKQFTDDLQAEAKANDASSQALGRKVDALNNTTAATNQAIAATQALTTAFSSGQLTPEQGGTRGAPGSWQDTMAQALKGAWFTNAPPRAGGGDVSAGQTYTVGERGPETLVMGHQSGTIVPNGGAASGGPQVINLVVDGRVLASIVNDHTTRQMKQGRQFPSA